MVSVGGSNTTPVRGNQSNQSVKKTTATSSPQPLSLNPRQSSTITAQDNNATSQNLFGPLTPLAQKSETLGQTLEQAISRANPPLSQEMKSALEDSFQELDTLTKATLNTPAKRQIFQTRLKAFVGQVQTANLMHGPVKTALNEVVYSSIAAMGEGAGIELGVAKFRGKPLGLSGPERVNGEQQNIIKESNDLLRASANWAKPGGELNGGKLLLLGLQDQVQRLLYEKILPPMEEQWTDPTVVVDEKILLEMDGLLEDLMSISEAIPADLLQDLTKMVETATKEGGQGLKDAFEAMADIGSAATDVGDGVNDATSSIQTLLNSLTNVDSPNIVSSMQPILTSYIAASNSAMASLPTLPFPITMPVPLNIPTGGGGNLTIPAGSTLSYAAGTGYTLTTNGFGMTSGTTNITSGTGTILLGDDLDQLNFSTLNVTDGSTQINMTNAGIEVDKINNSSSIYADQINVNMTNGQVSLSNASITQTANSFTAQGSDFSFTDGSTSITADQMGMGQVVNDDGSVVTGGALQGLNANADGTVINADQLSFVIVDDPDGADLMQLTGTNVSVVSGDDNISMDNALLNIVTNEDGSSVTTLATQNGSWVNGEQQITSSAAGFQINQDADGNITDISALASDLNYTNGSDTVNVTNGALNVTYGDNNQVSQITTELGQVDWANGNDWASATDVAGEANFGDDGQLEQLQLSAGQVQYGNESGALEVNGGALELNYDEDGNFTNGTFSGDSVSYEGLNGDDPLNVNVGAFTGSLSATEEGGQALNINAQDIDATVGETDITVDNVEQLQIITNAEGEVESFNLDAPGASTITTEELDATFKNIDVNYSEDILSASIENITGNLNQPEGLTGQFTVDGVQLWDTEKYTSLHIDSANADFTKLGEQYGLNVENVDLVLDKGEMGQLTGGELRFGDLEAHLKQYTITGTNDAGNQMIMSFGMDDSGEWVKQMALEIPEGGEISVKKGEDWFLTLGEQQQFEMNFDKDNNMFTFNAHNLNLQYGTDTMTVDVGGLNGNPAELQISVTEDGGIVIDDVSNVSGKITMTGVNGLDPIEIDIDKIKGYSTNNLVMQETNNGMMVHLKPDGPDSVITAEVRTSYKGIPLGLKLDNVHELKAGYELETNRGMFYLGDPSGRGHIEIKAGPLKLEGSEIQVEAKYHQYDTQRMLNSLDKLSSDSGLRVLGDYVLLDPVKGKLTLDTGNEAGPYLQTNFMFTSPIRAAAESANMPQNFMGMMPGVRDDAFGFTIGTGARWRSDGGTKLHQLGLDLGLLPGSYLSVDVQKGQASLAGIPLPDYMTIGTTPYAGLNYKQKGPEHRFSSYIGAFANPAALAPEGNGIIAEDKSVTWGATAGFKYYTSDYTTLGLQYVGTGAEWQHWADTSGDNQWNHSIMGNIGFHF